MHLGKLMAGEREQKRMSQREVGQRLGLSQVAISRMESSPELPAEEVYRYLEEVDSPYAKKICAYLESEWDTVAFAATPPLDHPNLNSLMMANDGLHRIKKLIENENIPEADFIRDEIDLYGNSLRNAVKYLLSLDHTVGFIGSIGVGKTTAICAATHLLLDGKPVLDYGGGRTTICEVVINKGPSWGLIVEPRDDEEIDVCIDEFCEYTLSRATMASDGGVNDSGPSDSIPNLNTELTRCLRNMAGLAQRRDPATRKVIDEAINLARSSTDKEKFKLQMLERMNLRVRTHRELWHSNSGEKDPLHWLKGEFTKINHGRNPSFSVPKRINVIVPQMVLNGEVPLNISVIDTKGVDQFAPRSDISALFDDPRALCIICSRFLDAPDETSRSVLKHAVVGGLRERLLTEAQLVVLDRSEEAESVNDFDGSRVANGDDGRQVRRADIEVALAQELQLKDIQITFFNQKEDSPSIFSKSVEGGLDRMRADHIKKIEGIVGQVKELEKNLEKHQESACYKHIGKRIQTWIQDNKSLEFELEQVPESLRESIVAQSTYASSVRASINRRGSWYNLNFYDVLAYGVRAIFVAASEPKLKMLTALLDNLKQGEDMQPARAFVDELRDYIAESSGQLQKQAELISEAIFEEPLREDSKLWGNCQERWGGGKGYKVDIARYTDNWLNTEERQDLFNKLRANMGEKWNEFLKELEGKVGRAIE